MRIKCPCCKTKVEKKKLKLISSLIPIEGYQSETDHSHLESFMITVSKYPNMYQWACDECIKTKEAILGNPKKQNYRFKDPMETWHPFFAYYDKRYTCEICKEKTVFTKEEQKYWYEKLSFIVYSKPISCKNCRKEIRATRNMNTELSELLKEGTPKEKSKLLRISEIYKEMGKIERMKHYKNKANKK